MGEAYSSLGHTSVLKAVSLTLGSFVYVSLEEAQCTVCASGYSVYVGVPRQARRDVNPQVSSAGHSLQDLFM